MLLAVSPDRFGSLYDVAVLAALVDDSKGLLVTVAPIVRDVEDRARMYSITDAIREYAEADRVFRDQECVTALRRVSTWPLDEATEPETRKDG